MGKKRVVIAGGSGFLGRSLARFLVEREYQVVVLSRSVPSTDGPWRHIAWDGRTCGEWLHALDGADAVVNLAGRTVDCIKTPEHCDEILRSRVESTLALGDACRRVASPPKAWVQMSTAHIYGDPPSAVCDEDGALGYGLAPTVGRAWERAFDQAKPESARGVVLRSGFVIGAGGGALGRLGPLARLGLGGPVGCGKQGMSWVHSIDMNRLLLRGIEDESMHGVYIATAPNLASSRAFMRALRHAVGMPIGLLAPSFLVRLGAAWVLRTDPEVALYGRYCVSKRLKEEGFAFEFPELGPALADIYARRRT
ncbi:MAG: DUF1731 domain-containing protein [Planctomycetota bacterium]